MKKLLRVDLPVDLPRQSRTQQYEGDSEVCSKHVVSWLCLPPQALTYKAATHTTLLPDGGTFEDLLVESLNELR